MWTEPDISMSRKQERGRASYPSSVRLFYKHDRYLMKTSFSTFSIKTAGIFGEGVITTGLSYSLARGEPRAKLQSCWMNLSHVKSWACISQNLMLLGYSKYDFCIIGRKITLSRLDSQEDSDVSKVININKFQLGKWWGLELQFVSILLYRITSDEWNSLLLCF